ncbi:MAG: hypothetical protein Tp1125DCM238401_40 [Prokaryotic dsDNA virus sp.]|nr:MAG: hypothetical protein Tp1125DCM238401_40 [Prokaryotic dsDNA virus sp.]|tara:strand:- start:502 stop:684 length:183 start_codon:yes stop_codon:yes gene_type:complete
MKHVIVVLDDGETYSGIDGASVCIITDEQHEKLCEGYSLSDIDPVIEIGLSDCTLQGGEA